VTSEELEARHGLPAGWIIERTGISARRVAGPEDSTAALAIEAGKKALASAGLEAADVDLVMVATCSPDVSIPSTAALVQAGLGATRAGAVDVGAACAGFLYALAQADGLIVCGSARRILICGAEIMSRGTQNADPRTAVLFGDGAGAVVVEQIEGASRVGPFYLAADGSQADLLWAGFEDRTIHMRGRAVYLRAVTEMAGAVRELLQRAHLNEADIDLLVAHQANARILSAVAERLGMSEERVYSNIARLGNTSGASIPLALCDAVTEDRVGEDDVLVLTAFGAGFVWAAGLVRWGAPMRDPLVASKDVAHA
jgi:3-oxoacyl-[acyl-carrier-protein] synthase-3